MGTTLGILLSIQTVALQAESSGDWLVSHLQALIDAAFNMATGTAEALRPHGLKLLRVSLPLLFPDTASHSL